MGMLGYSYQPSVLSLQHLQSLHLSRHIQQASTITTTSRIAITTTATVITHIRVNSVLPFFVCSVGGQGVTVVTGDGTILLDSFVVLISAYSYTHMVKLSKGTQTCTSE